MKQSNYNDKPEILKREIEESVGKFLMPSPERVAELHAKHFPDEPLLKPEDFYQGEKKEE